MKGLKTSLLTAILMLTAVTATSFAQGPLYKRINYTINVPYELKMGDVVFPAGKYVLYQLSLTNPNLFALYRNDLTHPPVALIHTVRIDYSASGFPEKTKILLKDEEEGLMGRNPTVIKGWTIPGTDGWEVVGVVTDRDRILAEVR